MCSEVSVERKRIRQQRKLQPENEGKQKTNRDRDTPLLKEIHGLAGTRRLVSLTGMQGCRGVKELR